MPVWSPSEARPGVVEPEPGQLSDAIGSELAVDDAELSAAQLGARSLRLRCQVDGLLVAIARTDAEFEKRRAFRDLDPTCTKASQWLAKQTRVPVDQARAAFRRARRLALLPALQAAVIGGLISFWHATAMTKVASSPARIRRLRADVDVLVVAARELSADRFDTRLRMWIEEHFAAEAESEAQAAEDSRAASVGRNASSQPTLSARLHPVDGTAVLTQLSRIEHELFEAEWTVAKAVHGDQTRFEHLPRTAEQRRADALVEMARRADAATPGAPTRRPLVTLLVGFDAVRSRVAEIEDGTHLTTNQALRAMTVSDLERAALGQDDRIAVSHKARLFRGAERRAVEIRDQTCTEDGCDARPDECDVDHVVRYEDDGPTEQGNGRLRCCEHHEGRRRAPEIRPLPWDHVEDDWDTLESERAAVDETWRRSA